MKTQMKLRAIEIRFTAAVCATLVLACGSVGAAQLPTLKEIPAEASAEAKAKLEPERNRLVQEIAAIRASWGAHENNCRSVVEGSSEHRACVANRDALVARRVQLDPQVTAFHATFHSVLEAEIIQLQAEEDALSSAIQASLETMRAVVNSASQTADEQLRTLAERVTRQLEQRKRIRVRRSVIAVAGVRG